MNYPAESTLRDRTFDRLKRSLAGEEPDGHAVFNYYTFPFFHNVTGVPLDQYFHDPKTTFEIQTEVFEQLEKCGSYHPDVGPVAECSALGGIVRFDSHGFISVKESGIEELDEALELEPGDPYGDNYMRVALETLEYMVDHAPADIKVNAPNFMAPFTVAAQLRGIGDFCADTIMEPEFVQALLDVTTETSIRYMKACQKVLGRPLHHILMSDDLSSFLSLPDYKKWVVPTYEKIFAAFPDTQIWLHNDASANHLCEAIADVGFKAWQYTPSIPSDFAMEHTGSRICLFGGLSPLELQTTSAQETYDMCIEKLKSFGGNNKFVLGVGGSVNQVPVANLMAMFHAADDFKI